MLDLNQVQQQVFILVAYLLTQTLAFRVLYRLRYMIYFSSSLDSWKKKSYMQNDPYHAISQHKSLIEDNNNYFNMQLVCRLIDLNSKFLT